MLRVRVRRCVIIDPLRVVLRLRSESECHCPDGVNAEVSETRQTQREQLLRVAFVRRRESVLKILLTPI
jgi:hypothetical protein